MVDLVDIERPLALFAEGIAGRHCHLKVGEEDAADRSGVYLPGSIDLFEDEALNAAIYRLRVLVQLGFREFGTYAFDIGRARNRLPALAVASPARRSPRVGPDGVLRPLRSAGLWPDRCSM